MISEAELRRQRFLEAKANAGGTAADLIKQNSNTPARIYFDEQGTILCVTTDIDTESMTHWTHYYDFTREQVSILKNKNHNLFYIKQDPLVENLYSIESKPVESLYVTADEEFLSIVETKKTKNYDIECKLTANTLKILPSKQLVKKYQGIDPSNMVARGKKVLKFYLTAKNDPHFMFMTVNVGLAKLISSGSVEFNTDSDLSQCSIYTLKTFDKYVRT